MATSKKEHDVDFRSGTLPDASLYPVDPGTEIKDSDIKAGLIKMVVQPWGGIGVGDEMSFRQDSPQGGWGGWRTVEDTTLPLVVPLHWLAGRRVVTISYAVRKADGTGGGSSNGKTYTIV